ncbi:phosphatidylinositol-glycan biosynthesis class X protein isoform X3 [Ambystoma mexicanum]|uniref:phosphatidylinositol-glycan biosynthesis class X protein isoform X3 n=1 Tax=Ambystoma mexicanum TaxID=8296 RepID=UPI0037E807EE
MNDAILTQMDFLMLCLCLALIPFSGAGATCPEVTVTRKILNEGFHRHLVSQVTIAGFPGPVNGCKVLFKEMLPNGLYLDPYQLASLQEHNLTEAVLPDIVDVEAPAYLSAVHTAFIFTKPEPGVCTECFRSDVPVHIRYHQPSGESGEAFVALKRPQLLIHCSMGINLGECWKLSEVEAPCAATDSTVCKWTNIKYTLVPEELSLQVPVGIQQHSPVICTLTLVVTLSCTIMLLAAVYRHGRLEM